MAAVFTGNGLGLWGAGWGMGGAGDARLGQGADRQFVNVATGNLVLQGQDEQLLYRGLPVALLRTYNSMGTTTQAGSDGWVTGFERRVELLSGTFNTAGSVMRRHTGDGSFQDFTWSAANTYVSASGDGAHDQLTWTSGDSTWSYVEGSSRRTELYANHADGTLQGRLIELVEGRSDGVTPTRWAVVYDASNRISEIRANDGTSTGDALIFGYDGSGRLSNVSTRENGVVRDQVQYSYDAQGRLASVLVDLTPQDGGGDRETWDATTTENNDGYLFRTTYTYVDATSLRISQVLQSDGTLASYTYDGNGRVLTATRGDSNANDADGVGETVIYAYGAGSTTVTDSLNRAWTYAYDASGQLTSVTAPALSGQSDVTSYIYDAAGNLTQAKTVRGAATLSQFDYQYDANGNVLWQWDALGNAVQRTYSASQQVQSETRYTGVDPDRTGAALPTNGLTTNFVYDSRDRLRFVVNAAGEVTEYQYASTGNGIGQQSSVRRYGGGTYASTYTESALAAWATNAQKANSALVEYSYDLWGRLAQTNAYAAVDANGIGLLDAASEVTRYTYDAQGSLLQTVALAGAGRTLGGAVLAGSEVVDYLYDGMGRLLAVNKHSSETAASNDTTTVSTTYAYLDSGHQIAVTADTGRVRTETRNAAGRLITVTDSGLVAGAPVTRTSRNYYDAAGQLRAAEDANGGRSYLFYDTKGRLEATVDSTGAVARNVYDGADHIVQTIEYANRVTTTTWLSAGAVTKATFTDIGVVVDAINDRSGTATYDTAGRLATQVDAAGTITTYSYDAANRLIQVKVTDAAQTAATARTSRFFYDAAGRQIAALDGEGFLTETAYDLIGRPTSTTLYATVSPSAKWAAGTLAELRPTADPTNDQVTRNYFDGRGNRVGELDALGYLTEWTIDEAGNTRAERRYFTAVTWAGGDTLTSLRTRAAGAYRESRLAYNGLGQLITQTNPEGTVTRYSYDEAGRLVRTEVAQGTTEVREGYVRYNVFDEVIGEISGEGAERAKTLLLAGKTLNDPTLSETQLDLAYATYGTRHDYDQLGSRIESTDASGAKTWTFYDSAGRPTFVVRGMANAVGVANAQGEVAETRYNAFGDVVDTIAYTGRITLGTPGSRASASSAISALSYASTVDTRRQYTYTTRGLLASVLDAENVLNRFAYNAFGERSLEEQAVGAPAALTIDNLYDRRGLLTTRTEGVGTADVRAQSQTYDAFGRVISATDARSSATTFGYDRLGRQVTRTQTVQGRVEQWTTAYDAYARVTSTIDASGRTTGYSYSTPNRTVTVTTPEGTSVETLHNRHGQTLTVTNIKGEVVSYTYDRDGNLVESRDALNQASTREYDKRGLLSATVDATGRRVELSYDAAGRVLKRLEDPAGLALATTYAYDGQGRQLTVTDASGRTTQQKYDHEGQLVETALDPAGLNLRTTYAYDAQGRVLRVTDANGNVVQYGYDVLGRRISEAVDPSGLNLVTAYAYDRNDNVIRRTDATGKVTRFYYNEANRLVYTVDPLGGMTRNWYDTAGRVVATRSFVQTTDATTLTDTTTIAQLDARLSWNSSDEGEYRVHDRDGRLRWTLDGGHLVETRYDTVGRVVATRSYATTFSAAAPLQTKLFDGTALDTEIVATINDSQDQLSYQVYDAGGRVRYVVDAMGGVREFFYDAANRQVGSRGYAVSIPVDATLKGQLVAGTATLATLATKVAVIDDDSRDLRTYTVFDAAGRARYSVDALGAVQEVMLDAAGRQVGTRRFAKAINVDATLLAKLVAGTALTADIVAKVTVDNAADVVGYVIHDAIGRVTASVDGLGFVQVRGYDAGGRLVSETAYADPIDTASLASLRTKLAAGTATQAEVMATVTATSAADRISKRVYDAAGRVRYVLTGKTATTLAAAEYRYDAAGRRTAEVSYGVELPSSTTTTVSAVQAAITAAGGDDSARQRLTRFAYDSAGHLRFTIDAVGAVSEQVFDGLGRVLQVRQYAQTVTVANATEANVAAAVSGIADRRTTTTIYDASGQAVSITDALNKTEYFAYDRNGLLIQYTDRNNAVWTYAYDAAGRRVSETSPQVPVATVNAAGAVTVTTRAVVTALAYDALGNVVSRTENFGQAEARITQYAYDSRGNQIRTTFPDAYAINEGTGDLQATGQTPTIEVTYDAQGRAVVQKDVRGNYSYKTYDALGRLAYEVDQEGYVTAYEYNAFGDQSKLTRFATAINTGPLAGWVAGQPLTFAQMGTAGVLNLSNSNNRALVTDFDIRGLKTSVTQSSTVDYYKSDGSTASGAPVTLFVHDVYGQLVKESVLLEGAPGVDAKWADTWRYYDALGRNDLTVDAEGYATASIYNANGDVIRTTEHARALDTAGLSTSARPPAPAMGDAVTGYDRVVAWSYDALGRKASESVVRRYQRADGGAGVRDVLTTYAYDNEDHLTGQTTEGATTTTTYDALGRALSVAEPLRNVLKADAESSLRASTGNDLTDPLYKKVSPYTALTYDAFGNVVQTRRYANGLDEGQTTPVADNTADQIEVTRYDRQGRAVMTIDAGGYTSYSSYDAADHVVHTWYVQTGSDSSRDANLDGLFTYDKVGRQLTNRRERHLTSGGTVFVEQSETVAYNAFGEIVQKTQEGLGGALTYTYDIAGRLLTSNEGGAVRNYGYNLAGHQVRESHTAYLSTGQSVQAVNRTVTDRNGRTVATYLPSNSAEGTIIQTSQKLDRWGNAIEVIDGRGYQTKYQYNDHNQIIRDERPLVQVVSETGVASWTRPVNQWFYDAFGRLVGTRDANGNIRTNVYDQAGQLLSSSNALGQQTLYAYDAFGNQRIEQNPLGYLTFKQYDRLNRITAMGDFLPDATGQARGKDALQQYVLNRNGDRLKVTDLLGHEVRYDYDGSGHMIRSQTAMGVVKTFAFDAAGHKSVEADAIAQLSWSYDIHGRLVDHVNLSGRNFDYAYDAASGQQTAESSTGGAGVAASKSISYYANGQVREVVEAGGWPTFRYEYDASGNRTLEETITIDGGGQVVHTKTSTWYDSHNRIQRVVQDDLVSAKRVFDMTYQYDAVGNRRSVKAISGYGPNVDSVPVDNAAPVIGQAVADRYVRKGKTGEFRILPSDVFRDAEQNKLSLLVTQGDDSPLPSWLQFAPDPVTGQIVFTASPAAGAADQDLTVKLRAYETATPSNQVSTTFVVRVRANNAPQLVAPGSTNLPKAKTGQAWAQELAASDWFKDFDVGDRLTLSIVGAAPPAWLSVDVGNPTVVRLSGTPTASSTFTLTVRATDELNATVDKTFVITTGPNIDPALVPGSLPPVEALVGRDFSWIRDISQLFTDGDGDALRVTASGVPSWMSFNWLGDQATPQLKLTGAVPGTVSDGTNYAITLTATDPLGASKSIVLSVTARINRGPVVQMPSGWTAPPLRVHDNYDITLPISAFFADPEGDQIFVEPVGFPSWLTLSVDQTAKTVRLYGTPTSNTQAGVLSFQLRGRDGSGLSGTTNVSMTVGTDNPPVANGMLPNRTVQTGRPINFPLPAGLFTDADGDTLGYSAYYMKRYWDQESQTEYFEPETLPSWLGFNPTTGTFSGTGPATVPGQNVMDVRVIVSDGRNSIERFFNLTIVPFVNATPTYTAGSLPNRTLVHGGAVDFALPAGAFVEPDGDTLTYSAEVQVGSTWMTLSQLGLAINTSSGRITGTAINLTQATFSARVYASDPQGLRSLAGTFTFNVTNTPPVASTIPAQTAYRNVPWSLATASYFSDVNQNPLTYTASLPAGLSINSTTGVITGAPSVALGSYAASVTVNDGRGGTVTANFTIAVQNSAPVAPTINNVAAEAGTAWSFVIPQFTDPNGDTLTYTASGLASWMAFDPGTRTLSGTPGPVGSWSITVTAKDPSNATASRTFTVSTPNTWPAVINQVPTQTAYRNIAWSYQVPTSTFADVNGDSLTYSASSLPSGITFDPATRTFSGAVGTLGNYTLVVTANDGRGGTASEDFTLTVANLPPSYTAGSLPNRNWQWGQAVSSPLPGGAFTDPNSDGLSYTLYVERPGYWENYEHVPGEPDVRWKPATWLAASSVGLNINASTGAIGGTANWMGIDTGLGTSQTIYNYNVKIVASDGLAAAEGVFNLNVNRAPIAPVIGTQNVRQGLWTSFAIPAFGDVNGDTVSYSASGVPAGLSFNAGTFSGTPSTAGSYTVTVTANDGKGGVTSTNFTLVVNANRPPVMPSVPEQWTTAGGGYGYQMPWVSDPDWDTVSLSVTGLPPGINYDAGNSVISGVPTTPGNYLATYWANDGLGGVASTSFWIHVAAPVPVNVAPQVAIQPGYIEDFYKGQLSTFVLSPGTFTDANNDPLTYTIISKPAFLSYSFIPGAGHRFSGTPTGTQGGVRTVVLRASDPSGAYVDLTFSFWVEAGGDDLLAAPDGEAQSMLFAIDIGESLTPDGMDSIAPMAMQAMAATIPVQTTEQWFTYDAENRLKINNGELVGGQIQLKSGDQASHELTYDAAGRQVARYVRYENGATTFAYRTTYDLRGNKTLEFHNDVIGSNPTTGGVETSYTYDVTGRLLETRGYFDRGTVRSLGNDAEGFPRGDLDISGWLTTSEEYAYDLDDRIVSQVSRKRTTTNWWQLAQQLETGTGLNQYADLNTLTHQSTVTYVKADGSSGYDLAGRAVGYRYTGASIGWAVHTYTTTFEGWESYQEKTVAGDSSNQLYKPTTNTLTYDGMGRLLSQREHTNYDNVDDRARYYSQTMDGRVQSRRAGTINSSGVFVQDPGADGNRDNVLYVHAAGQQMAELHEGGQIRYASGYVYNTPQLASLGGRGNYGAGGSKVIAQAGETLTSLAQRVYGNGSLWYVLADANGLSDPEAPLIEGTSLNAPSVNVNSNDAGTFKPYNPNEAIGSTSPTLPYIAPPPKESCNAVAAVLMIVIVAVVAWYVGPMVSSLVETAGIFGTGAVATGVTVGTQVAIGSAVSQGAGSVAGVTSFSWKQVAVEGISAGITAGFGQWARGVDALTKGGEVVNGVQQLGTAGRVAQGLVSYGGAVVANATVGRDTYFSWDGVAATAIGSYIGAKIGIEETLPVTDGATQFGRAINDFAGGYASGLFSATSRRMFGLGEQDWRQIGVDAFGNALGKAAVRGIGTWQTNRAAKLAELQRGSGTGGSRMLNDPNYRPDWLYGDAPSADEQFVRSLELTALKQAVEERSDLGQIGTTVDANGKPTGYYVPGLEEVDATLNPTGWRATTDTLIANTLRYHIGNLGRGVNTPYELPSIDASPSAWVEHNRDLQYWLYENRPATEHSAVDAWLKDSSEFMFSAAGAMQGKEEFMGLKPVWADVNNRELSGYISMDTASSYAWSAIPAAIGGVLSAGRVFTNKDVRLGFANSVAHPISTARSGWQHWTSLSGMEKFDAVYSFGTGMVAPGAGATKLIGRTGRVANNLPELRPGIRSTFLNGEAVVSVLDEPLVVQRFHGGGSSAKGSFATTDIFKSRVDVREQLALPYTWADGAAGNAVTKVTTIELPAGTRIWSGRAAPQIDGISGRVYQGGGDQIYIDAWIKDEWITDTRWFRSDRGKN